MSLIPMSRESMESLKATTENNIRLALLGKIVAAIYTCAVTFAKQTTDTTFRYPLIATYHEMRGMPNGYLDGVKPEFYRNNMPEILGNLQELFPECFITHANLTRGQDGKMYTTSNIEESIRPFLNIENSKEYIIIDWS